jgi:hypothetical protein
MGTRLVSEADVLAVAAEDDDVLRNLRITQTYHQLSNDIIGLIGDRDANWCAFATWASRSVGDTMRLEVIPAFIDLTVGQLPLFDRVLVGVEEHLREARLRLLRPVRDGKEHRLRDLLQYVCHQLGDGNRIVFLEVGIHWTRFTASFAGGPNDEGLAKFVPTVVNDAGQPLEHLQNAFVAYHEAMREPDLKRRAEYVLAANCLIGSWEQARLQDFITNAVEAPVAELVEELVREPLDHLVPHAQTHRILERGISRVQELLEDVWRDLATEGVMVCQLPDADIALGRDLSPWRHGLFFPSDLQTLSLPDVIDVWGRYNRADANGRHSAASDWLVYADRMNFIVNLFRSRQQDPVLIRCPFTDEQLRMVADGQVPTIGDL